MSVVRFGFLSFIYPDLKTHVEVKASGRQEQTPLSEDVFTSTQTDRKGTGKRGHILKQNLAF